MKYSNTNIIGDAGEHLVAARIIDYFGFPCRLQNIDIGIDAEIEITNTELKSTGNFVKAQIKSTRSNDMSVLVSEKHIRYWNNLDIPVVIMRVHLSTDKIYWHCVDDLGKYEKSGRKYKVEFDKKMS